jgi:hypothetical protein
MNRRVWTGTCAAIVSLATSGMLAQTSAQAPAAPQSAPSSSEKITVTGCLKAAPSTPGDTASVANPSPTGTAGSTEAGAAPPAATGTSGAPPAEARFILTAATTTPAAANTAESVNTAQTYRLIANPTALSEHVGKTLELVGTIDPTSTPDPKDPSAAAPALRIESGKIVAASCSQ